MGTVPANRGRKEELFWEDAIATLLTTLSQSPKHFDLCKILWNIEHC